jgi:ATP-binding cassette subfamily B protein
MISRFYGKKYQLKTLVNNSFYTRKGISLKGLSHSAESIGFRTIGVNTSYDKLCKEQPVPFIIYPGFHIRKKELHLFDKF